MLKICFYAPESHVEKVKSAMFAAGAGKIGNYSCCAWQVLGMGQFKPEMGSNAFIGKQGTVEYVPEYKVEMVCDDKYVQAVIKAMKQMHPYEEPAYQVWRLELICSPSEAE